MTPVAVEPDRDTSPTWIQACPPEARSIPEASPSSVLGQAPAGKPDCRCLCARLGSATSRPHLALTPGLDNPRPGSGQDRSSGFPANHRWCRLGHRRRPGSLDRRSMDRPFRPSGGNLVALNDRNLRVIYKLRRPIAQAIPMFFASFRGRSPRRCGFFFSGKQLRETGFATSSTPKAARLCAARPPSVLRR